MDINNNIFKQNKKILTNYVDIHPDDIETLEGSIVELINTGVGVIEKITFKESDSYNWIILICDDKNQEYYLELSEHGTIAVLRKNGLDDDAVLISQCGTTGNINPPSI